MAKRVHIQGVTVIIPVDETSIDTDYKLDIEQEFHGVMIFLEDPVFGDEIDLKIIAPDGTTLAHDYSANTFLTSKINFLEITLLDKDDPVDIPANYIMRFTYNAVDSAGRKAQVWYRFKR